MVSYNKNIPAGFPPATADMLKQFQVAYPTLFKNSNGWSIAKHRKRLIDWLISNRGHA